MIRINTEDFVPRWQPTGSTREHFLRPPVGAIIELNRRPYRVAECREIDPTNWTEEEQDTFARRHGANAQPEQWWQRPWTLVVDELPEGKRMHARIPGNRRNEWFILPEHYPVCVHCQELHPCRHMTTEAEVARGEAKLDKLTSIAPGCCWWCGDKITSRQKKVSFEGPNLLLPGGHSPVEFHGRAACSTGVWSYENKIKDAAERG